MKISPNFPDKNLLPEVTVAHCALIGQKIITLWKTDRDHRQHDWCGRAMPPDHEAQDQMLQVGDQM